MVEALDEVVKVRTARGCDGTSNSWYIQFAGRRVVNSWKGEKMYK